MASEAVRVFISYAHESTEHVDAVRQLWVFLRAHGVDARLDLPAAERRQDWTLWMADEVRQADHILCIASPAYKRRAEGHAAAGEGRGVQWEARLIRDAFYADQMRLDRFLPVVLPGGSIEDIPDFLAPHTSTVYQVEAFTLSGSDKLYRLLIKDPAEVEPALGAVIRRGPNRNPPVPILLQLRHSVLIQVTAEGGQLVTRTFLAGTELGSHRAAPSMDLDRIWEAVIARQDAAALRTHFVTVGRGLAAAMFDAATMGHLLKLADESPLGTVVDISIVADELTIGLPFEALTTPDGRPLVLVPGVRLTRRLAGVERQATAPLPGPLKILAAVAAPDETCTDNEPLDVEAEMQAVLDATSDLDGAAEVQVRILEVASLQEITAALKQDQYHVLHLSAHGNRTGIELEDEDGNAAFAATQALINAVRAGGHGLPLIVLSSCAGADGGVDGLATMLIKRGADRVLGMQAAVTDPYATEFARHLYQRLADDPDATVGQALAMARQEVDAQQLDSFRRGGDAGSPQYPVPTLLAAGDDPPLRTRVAPPVPLTRPTLPASGTGVRDLPIGQLIGRRRVLRDTLAALRGTQAGRVKIGDWGGVALTGIGGIGKSAVAGRAVSRLREEEWLIAEHDGRWNPTNLIRSVANTLALQLDGQELAHALRASDKSDTDKLRCITDLLRRKRLLLVFDDFEQNLSDDGKQFIDPGFAEIFEELLAATGRGRLLVTCRYPIPGDGQLLRLDLPPLTISEQRRLYLRLLSVQALSPEDRRLITRMIGGHPRLLEFLDVLLRHGTAAQHRHVANKLRGLANAEQIDLALGRELSDAISDAVRLGSRDILLDGLLYQLNSPQRELILQAALSIAPFSQADLAVAVHGKDLNPKQLNEVIADAKALLDRTLLSPEAGSEELVVHPWIGQALDQHQGEERTLRHSRAATMRYHRLSAGRGGFYDLVELIRHLAASDQYDDAVAVVWRGCELLNGQLAISALLGEVVPLIPPDHPEFLALADFECQSLILTGRVTATITRRQQLLQITRQRVSASPDDAISQRDLSISHEKLGDLALLIGDVAGAGEHHRAALAIRERLAAADQGNAQAHRDLSISHSRLGDLALRAGDRVGAGEHHRAALAIDERVAAADPGNAEAQRDLSISHGRLGDLALRAGDVAGAGEHHRAALAIRERLAAADPGNAEAQRDLSISHGRLGDLALRAGDVAGAGEHHRAALAIQERLAAADPDDAQAQRGSEHQPRQAR